MKKDNLQKGEIVIYKTSKNEVDIKVRFEKETVWLDAHQIALLFGVNRPSIVKHVNNIYKINELSQNSTCSILEQVAADGKIRKMNLYNLDMIISVGYRVNSSSATQFRIWASNVLKQYLIKGYAINENRLLEAQNKFHELKETVVFLQKQSQKELLKGQETEILTLLADYSRTLSLLEQYDKGVLTSRKGQKARFVLNYEACTNIVAELKK